ncbi:PREDICTED: protein CHROMOSOME TRANSMISSION FIDELITY 7-like isoform X2 [Camelina sativa]|uniref:Protein CHROMOSOME TRANSMISSION FIDELITY 7-like isoform X2 n=1 Tax=Camelina sativa TaxID=90675 RepID=A0ABM0U9U4_CAMSA|nr:PREDICTED: protein CHROMOSOME TRANSMISSION FIDELITY 7-like isoform X2 [Camelina sativa]
MRGRKRNLRRRFHRTQTMQAKINSFFKPSSSSSSSTIAASVTTTSDTDDDLAVWEQNRNVIVNTFQRRSAIPDRSEVLKKGSSSSSSSYAPKNLKKKRSYTQFYLELGQSDFLLRHCDVCGIKYAPGDESDEKNHHDFHKGWLNEKAFTMPSFNKSRIVMLSENDSHAHRNKVKEVLKMMEVELGEDWILHQHCKVYLFVSSQRISGCLVAEPIKEAFKLISPPDDERQLKKETSSSPSTSIQFGNIVLQREVLKRCRASDDRLDNGAIVCEEEAKPAICGIRAIWVSPSNRRKGIATQLLDTTRESFCNNGCTLEKSQLAFSQPSSMGRSFGFNYFGTSSFLVYKAP